MSLFQNYESKNMAADCLTLDFCNCRRVRFVVMVTSKLVTFRRLVCSGRYRGVLLDEVILEFYNQAIFIFYSVSNDDS